MQAIKDMLTGKSHDDASPSKSSGNAGTGTTGNVTDSSANRLTSNYGAAQTGDFGGTTGNAKHEFRVGEESARKGHVSQPGDAQRAGGAGAGGQTYTGTNTSAGAPQGYSSSTGTSTGATTGTGTGGGSTVSDIGTGAAHDAGHRDSRGTGGGMFNSAPGAAVGGGISGQGGVGQEHHHHHGHGHEHTQGSGEYTGGSSDTRHAGATVSDIGGGATHSTGHQDSRGTGGGMFNSAPGAAVGGGISGNTLGQSTESHGHHHHHHHQQGQQQQGQHEQYNFESGGNSGGGAPEHAQKLQGSRSASGPGMDGAGEGYHDRVQGANMGNYYDGKQPGY